MHNTVLLVIVVVTAVSFDFTNGFHDTANAMATSIATGALRPRLAVALSGALNLLGAFLSVSVAATIANGIVDSTLVTLPIMFSGLLGAIVWNVLTWYFGLPSSSSHALVGGVIGATAVAAGWHAVKVHSLLSKVVLPAVLSPFIAGFVAAVATFVAYRAAHPDRSETATKTFRYGQLASASLVSLAHGTNDAQKTMGVVTLALVADGRLHHGANPPLWVIATCGVAIAAGTSIGGWRVIRTVGHRLTEITPPQGFSAEAASAAVLLISTHGGVPLSTTQITTGSVIGSGIGKRAAQVHWDVAGRMAGGWVLTIPAAAAVAAAIGAVTKGGSNAPVYVVAAVAVLVLTGVFVASLRNPVTAGNVNDVRQSPQPRPVPVAAGR